MVSDEDLGTLINGLSYFKQQGIVDPWVLDDGTTIEPLEVILELQRLRQQRNTLTD